jgi:hypothetical protein
MVWYEEILAFRSNMKTELAVCFLLVACLADCSDQKRKVTASSGTSIFELYDVTAQKTVRFSVVRISNPALSFAALLSSYRRKVSLVS